MSIEGAFATTEINGSSLPQALDWWRIRIMELDIERKLQEIRMENRKFVIQAILAAGGLMAAGGGLVAGGAAVFRLVCNHSTLR